MCRGPYRRRMGVDFKIGLGGHPSLPPCTQAPLRRGLFLCRNTWEPSPAFPDLLWCGRRETFRSMTKLEPRFGGAFFLSHGRGWDAALLGLLEAVAHHGEAGGVDDGAAQCPAFQP